MALNTCTGSAFTISGSVTNGTGQGIADVTMILESDVAPPQIVFTNQSGNYVFTYAANLSHNLKVTPSKSGFSFSPLAIVFTSTSSVSGDKDRIIHRNTECDAACGTGANFVGARKLSARCCSGLCDVDD